MAVTIERPNLSKYQNDILYSDKRFTITEACTKSGKTFSHLFWLFEEAHKEDTNGKNFWWVAPVFSQSKIAFNRLLLTLGANSKFYKINGSNLKITTPLGSVIQFKSADNHNNLYGEDVQAAVFDEFTRSKPESWTALRSTLTATRGKCKLIGNYISESNWGHKLAMDNIHHENTEYAYFKITAHDAVEAGILHKEEIEQAKKDLPTAHFKALYLCEGSIDASSLFNSESLNSLNRNTHVTPNGKKYLSVDVAMQGNDRLVIGYWNGFVLQEIITRDKTQSDQINELIRGLMRKHSIPENHVVFDGDGIGNYLSGVFKRAVEFRNNARALKGENYKNLKSQCYFKLAKLINNQKIYLVDDSYNSEIHEELEFTKISNPDKDSKLSIITKDEIKAYIGRSPDFADMMAMRMYFELKPNKVMFVPGMSFNVTG